MRINVITCQCYMTFAFQIDKGERSYGCIFEKSTDRGKILVHDNKTYTGELYPFENSKPPAEKRELVRQVVQFAYDNLT